MSGDFRLMVGGSRLFTHDYTYNFFMKQVVCVLSMCETTINKYFDSSLDSVLLATVLVSNWLV